MVERQRIVVVTPGERTPGPATPGMERQQAVATEGMWSGVVRTDPGMVSGWHHHGDHETVIYVLTGSLRMEFGPGGAETVEAAPGDFLHVPRGASTGRPTPRPSRPTSSWSAPGGASPPSTWRARRPDRPVLQTRAVGRTDTPTARVPTPMAASSRNGAR
jgi:uncharacterized RmlC-like cupin family protein